MGGNLTLCRKGEARALREGSVAEGDYLTRLYCNNLTRLDNLQRATQETKEKQRPVSEERSPGAGPAGTCRGFRCKVGSSAQP
eukprot:3561434-Prymnesium_polylepis.1